MILNLPSGSGGAVEVGTAVDVRTKLNFIGKSGTDFAGQIFTAIDLGGTYVGSSGVAGFTFNTPATGEYGVLIDDNYVANSGQVIAMMIGTPYEDAFPTSSCTWKVGRIG